MVIIYEADDGLVTQERLYWEFIKSIEKYDEYAVWHKAIVKKEIKVLE